MAITRWTPYNWGMPRVFDEDDFDLDSFFQTGAGSIDIYEENDNVVVKMKAPGFEKSDFTVTVVGDNLTIKAEANEEKEDKGKKYYKKEIKTQSIARSITLPSSVVSDKADAEYKNGVLSLTLPKSEQAKPKSISIK
jgi:HSP20 family protein